MKTATELLAKPHAMVSRGGVKVTRSMAKTIDKLSPEYQFDAEVIRDALELGLPKLLKARKRGKK